MMLERRRWKILIDRVQYRLLVGNFLYLMAVILVLVIAGISPLIQTLDNSQLSSAQRDIAAQHLLSLNAGMWTTLWLVLALCLTHSVIVSHRIAGPLYRLRQVLGDMARGDLTVRVRTRSGDYLVHEVDCVNGTIEKLERDLADASRRYREARDTLPRLVEALKQQNLTDATGLCGELEMRLDRLGNGLGKFVTTDTEATGRGSTPAGTVTRPTEPTAV